MKKIMIKSGRIGFVIVLTFFTLLLTVRDSSAAGGPLWEEFNMDHVPLVWSQMGNERLMYPMEMTDIATRIGPERQLFLDNCLLGTASNVTREVHQPVRYEGNPLLDAPPPLDNLMCWVQHVYQFDESPRFRMWYTPSPRAGWHDWKEGEKIRFVTSYAVSEDGMHWTQPDLGLHEIDDWNVKNVVLPYGLMHGLFYEPWEKDPNKRFKALVCVEAMKVVDGKLGELTIGEGYFLHWSPDGIHWEGDLENMIIPAMSRYRFPTSGAGDTSRFWWDSIRGKYIADTKLYVALKRCRAMMESDDLIHWSRPHPILFSVKPNHQVYGHRGFPYQGMYVGLRWRTDTDYKWLEVHSNDLLLDCSRDGRIWTRVGGDQVFMGRNFERDTWDADYASAVSLLTVGDEVWIYYFAAPPTPYREKTGMTKGHRPGLAKLRLDGFASLNGGEETGTVVTRPLTFKGKRFHINADIADGGEIRVGFRTRDGKRGVDGFTPEDCRPVTGDGINLPVSWNSGADISELSGSLSRIEFRLRNAKIYSFWIED